MPEGTTTTLVDVEMTCLVAQPTQSLSKYFILNCVMFESLNLQVSTARNLLFIHLKDINVRPVLQLAVNAWYSLRVATSSGQISLISHSFTLHYFIQETHKPGGYA